MTILLIIVLVIALLVAGVLILAASKPNSFRYSRSASIKAAPAKVYPLIANFHAWTKWSPYEGRDPTMQRTYGAIPEGGGSMYSWSGDNKIGAGSMEITHASSPSKLVIKLDFTRPFTAHNTAEFTIEPEGDGSRVTWAMFGPSPFMSKLMGVVMNFDQMIGKDFDTGLAKLKALAEG